MTLWVCEPLAPNMPLNVRRVYWAGGTLVLPRTSIPLASRLKDPEETAAYLEQNFEDADPPGLAIGLRNVAQAQAELPVSLANKHSDCIIHRRSQHEIKFSRQVLLALFVSCWPLFCAGQSSMRADRPEVKVGDNWVLLTSDARTGEKSPELSLTVREVSADNFVAETGRGERQTHTRDWNLIETKSGETVTFSATPLALTCSFP